MGLVPDPGFDDPAAWSFVGSGATITGSQLRFINANIGASDTVPTITPVVGLEHQYSFAVSTYPGSPITARILFGGVEIYNKDGAGTFTGSVTPTNTSGLVFQSSLVGQWFLDNIEITAMHVRQSIREAVVTAVTGLTTTGSNVFATRVRPVSATNLPCLLVYATDEVISLENGTLDAPMRTITVRVSGAVEANFDIDDTLDDIAEEVETALGADITRGGYAISTDLLSTTLELEGEAEKQVGTIHLDYLISYRTPFGDPSTVA